MALPTTLAQPVTPHWRTPIHVDRHAAPLDGRRALVVEDDPVMQTFTVAALRAAGAHVEAVDRGDAALDALARGGYDLVYLDLNLPGLDGLSVLAALPPAAGAARVIVVTSEATAGVAVEAMKRGAVDYLVKPASPEALVTAGATALGALAARPRPAVPAGLATELTELTGDSPALRRVRTLVQRVAPTRAHVLITGEPGAGKERLARLVHELSPRAEGRLVVVRCAPGAEAGAGGMLEAELFGAGTAGGTMPAHPGRVEEACGGTLVLHEIGALPPALQLRLLHMLRTRQLPRPDGGQPTPVDVRVVATSSVDLATEVAAGRFAPDLFFQLNVFPIAMPPLRERSTDVAPLAEHFLAEAAARHGLPRAAFAPGALRAMAAHVWPGNVAELRRYVSRIAILHAGETGLPFAPPDGGPAGATLERDLLGRASDEEWDLVRLEREYILAVLAATHGHQSRAAQRLGIDRRTLYRKLREYGVKS